MRMTGSAASRFGRAMFFNAYLPKILSVAMVASACAAARRKVY